MPQLVARGVGTLTIFRLSDDLYGFDTETATSTKRWSATGRSVADRMANIGCLLLPQRVQRINRRYLQRRNEARHRRDGKEQRRYRAERGDVPGARIV